jgi:thioredoxin-like negative regulator of GroEL
VPPSDDKPLLLFFTSPRSGPARRMESLLAHLARKERGRLRISVVDVEESPELAEKLEVSEIPTLVLVHDRRPVARLDGRASAPQIEQLLAPYVLAEPDREPAAA